MNFYPPFWPPQTINLPKKFKAFAETYFRGLTEYRLFAEPSFYENGQNSRNPQKFIHAKSFLRKIYHNFGFTVKTIGSKMPCMVKQSEFVET